MSEQIKIYPTITAINGGHLKKLGEAEAIGLEEICVFFSPLKRDERNDFYKNLEASRIKKIPFAHIRGDFDNDEIYYLKNTFGTEIFNLHSSKQHPILYDFGELKKEIYIENTMTKLTADEINDYAGLCLDISHLENDRLDNEKRYRYFQNLLHKMNVGCGHASAVKKENGYCPVAEDERYDKHFFDHLGEFDYLEKYKDILPPIIALEVENGIAEQLNAIKYIKKKLSI